MSLETILDLGSHAEPSRAVPLEVALAVTAALAADDGGSRVCLRMGRLPVELGEFLCFLAREARPVSQSVSQPASHTVRPSATQPTSSTLLKKSLVVTWRISAERILSPLPVCDKYPCWKTLIISSSLQYKNDGMILNSVTSFAEIWERNLAYKDG